MRKSGRHIKQGLEDTAWVLPNGLGIKRVTRLSYVKMDPTTSNIVQLTMLGVVVSMLAVVCKRMQQLPAMFRPAVHHGKDTTHKTLYTPRRNA